MKEHTRKVKSLRPNPKLVGQKSVLRINETEVEGTVIHYEREPVHGYVAIIEVALANGLKHSAIWDVFRKSIIRAIKAETP